MASKVIVLTSASSSPWIVPPDWNNASNTIEAIAGAGAGHAGGSTVHGFSGGGGGGGEYRKLTNQSLTVGASIAFTIGLGDSPGGTGGTNTQFLNSSTLLAMGGGTTTGLTGGASGTGGTGGTGFAGGAGGNGQQAASAGDGCGGGGGGGAGGSTGVGAAGTNGTLNGGGGTGNGGAGGTGDNATGGAGGSGGDPGGGNGANGTELGGGAAGAGGGGGGSSGTASGSANAGTAGLYGAGGAGSGGYSAGSFGTGSNGANGVIVITYTPHDNLEWLPVRRARPIAPSLPDDEGTGPKQRFWLPGMWPQDHIGPCIAPGSPTLATPSTSSGGSLPVGSYIYGVTAFGPCGESPVSNLQPATTTSGNQTVNLSWNRIAGATGYNVYRYNGTGWYLLTPTPTTGAIVYADAGTSATNEVQQPPQGDSFWWPLRKQPVWQDEEQPTAKSRFLWFPPGTLDAGLPAWFSRPKPPAEPIEEFSKPPRWVPGMSPAEPHGPEMLPWLLRPKPACEDIEVSFAPRRNPAIIPTLIEHLSFRRIVAVCPVDDEPGFKPQAMPWLTPRPEPMGWLHRAHPAPEDQNIEAPATPPKKFPWYMPGPMYGESLVWQRKPVPAVEEVYPDQLPPRFYPIPAWLGFAGLEPLSWRQKPAFPSPEDTGDVAPPYSILARWNVVPIPTPPIVIAGPFYIVVGQVSQAGGAWQGDVVAEG